MAVVGARSTGGGGGSSSVQFLHVGMPKAASTWLQNVFFDGHPELAVLGPEVGPSELRLAFVAAVERLVLGSDLQDAAAPCAAMADAALSYAGARGAAVRTVGLSHESFAGAWPTPRNAGHLARTLAVQFPGAKVLLVVREPRAALASGWREFVRMGGTLPFSRFVWDPALGGDPVAHPLETAVLGSVLYAPLVRLWRELVGADRLKVVPMERLQRDPAGFARELCRFLGVSEEFEPRDVRANVQLSGISLGVLRRCNHMFHTRRHVRYGLQPTARLLQRVACPTGPEWTEARSNPHFVRYRISDYCQRWLARKVLPTLDRCGLAALSGRPRDVFARLPQEGRAWLEQRFADDARGLAELVDWDPAEWGYLS